MTPVPSRAPAVSDSSGSMGRDTKLERVQSTGHVMLLCDLGEKRKGIWNGWRICNGIRKTQILEQCICYRSSYCSTARPFLLHGQQPGIASTERAQPLTVQGFKRCSLWREAQWGETSGEDQAWWFQTLIMSLATAKFRWSIEWTELHSVAAKQCFMLSEIIVQQYGHKSGWYRGLISTAPHSK